MCIYVCSNEVVDSCCAVPFINGSTMAPTLSLVLGQQRISLLTSTLHPAPEKYNLINSDSTLTHLR